MKSYLRSAIAIACLFLAGCKDPYGTCITASTDILQGVGPAEQQVDALRTQGIITSQEENNVLGYLQFINISTVAFATCANGVHTSGAVGGFTACVGTFTTTVNTPQAVALLKVNNPNGQKTINLIAQTLATGLAAVNTALGGK